MSKNDDKILQLKKVITEKKEELKTVKRFSPLTNCVLNLDNQTYNLNVLQVDDLKFLLIKLNMYLISANDLDIAFNVSGYNVSEWMSDIKSKIEIFEHKKKESDLKALESKLDKMLSDEKKTELELDEIASLLM